MYLDSEKITDNNLITESPIIQHLRRAKALISDSAHWVTNYKAVNKDGWIVDPRDKEAFKWCAFGALLALEGTYSYCSLFAIADDLLNKAALELHQMGYVGVNDHLGHEAILKVYDKAIELASQDYASGQI